MHGRICATMNTLRLDPRLNRTSKKQNHSNDSAQNTIPRLMKEGLRTPASKPTSPTRVGEGPPCSLPRCWRYLWAVVSIQTDPRALRPSMHLQQVADSTDCSVELGYAAPVILFIFVHAHCSISTEKKIQVDPWGILSITRYSLPRCTSALTVCAILVSPHLIRQSCCKSEVVVI